MKLHYFFEIMYTHTHTFTHMHTYAHKETYFNKKNIHLSFENHHYEIYFLDVCEK